MTKQLVEEIMQLETEAAEQLVKAATEHDTIIRKAHEKAIVLVQETEHTLDTEREEAIKQRGMQLQKEKEQTIAQARTEGKALAAALSKKVPKAANHLLTQFTEYARNDVS
jgi:vacuolar-type H+-ATPase subunit H